MFFMTPILTHKKNKVNHFFYYYQFLLKIIPVDFHIEICYSFYMLSEKVIFVFPGQGSQSIGMGADLAQNFAIAKQVFEEVDETLHQNLSTLMFSGDFETLTETQNAQPAIMAVSIAVFRVLQSLGFKMPAAVAGHSLGEYSALCAAGVLSLAETTRLLRLRGSAMAAACTQEKGGMLALIGATPEQAKEIAEQANCYVANDNAPGQIVLSGNLKTLEKAQSLAEKMSIKRAIPLAVMGAFHSPLMDSAANEMTVALQQTHFSTPQIPVYFNVTANIGNDVNEYARLLTQQITHPVRWCELIRNTQGSTFIECGPGEVLSGLIKRILPEVEIKHANTSENIYKLLEGKKC